MGTDQQPAPDIPAPASAPTRAKEDEWPETERPVWLGHKLHHWRFKDDFDAETNRYVASWPRWRASQARIADLATIIDVLVGVPQPSDAHGPNAHSACIDVYWGGAVTLGCGDVRPWGLDVSYSAVEFRELDEQMVREARGFEIGAAFVPSGHKNIARASRAVGRLIAAPAAIVTFAVTTARTFHIIS